MPELAALPWELFSYILDLALQDSDIPRLYHLSLLSRQWYDAVMSKIYSKWTYNGARQPFMTAWKFLVTVRRDPHLAGLVRTLNIGNWGYQHPHPVPLQLPDAELDLIRTAIHEAGIPHLEDDIMWSISKRDRRPVMALILVSLPRLNTVFAHVPRSDPVLGAVLAKILAGQDSSKSSAPALRELRELHLSQEDPMDTTVPRDENEEPDEDLDEEQKVRERNALRLDYLWPIFHLPSLRTISLFDVGARRAAEQLGDRAGSCIEKLCLVSHPTSNCTFPDVQTFISQPKALRDLAINIHDNLLTSTEVIANAELWECLQSHSQTLEKIDVYRFAPNMVHRMDYNGHFGILRGLQRLKHLSIQAEMILGGCCDEPLAPFRLRDTLPSTLKSLTLYGDEGFRVIGDLAKQLIEVVDSGEFPDLNSIILEKTKYVCDNSMVLVLSYAELQTACRENGVDFKIEEHDRLSMGGKIRDAWEEDMKKDARYRNKAVDHETRLLKKDYPEPLLRSVEELSDDEDLDDDSEDEYGPYLKGPTQNVAIPFTDHTGRAAYMAFESRVAIPLPPLFSFALYFTHADASPGHTDMVGILGQITGAYSDFSIRLDIYFLPNASESACIDHYHGEESARGSYKAQLKMFRACPRDEVHPLPGKTAQLPGMVDSYQGFRAYRSVLFIHSTPEDWRQGPRTLRYVEFDKHSRADYDHLPPVTSKDVFMNRSNPAYNSADPHTLSRADGIMFDMARWDYDVYMEPWQMAVSRGWTGW
ncbi:hypothetical protein PHISP_07556 [Aspergillus sp. HF37]|nr:hypothetical protein PHISP_07556 [Aspergillus sp. HF37]